MKMSVIVFSATIILFETHLQYGEHQIKIFKIYNRHLLLLRDGSD